MEIREYQQRAKQTAVYPEVGNNYIYPTLGLINEIGELLLADDTERIIDEAGDVLWYISCLCSELHIDLAPLTSEIESEYVPYPERMLFNAAEIAGIVKKVIRDNNGIMNYQNKTQIGVMLTYLLRMLIGIIPVSVEELAELNIEKLSGRKDRGTLHGSGTR